MILFFNENISDAIDYSYSSCAMYVEIYRGVRSLSKKCCPVYDTKLYLIVRLNFWILRSVEYFYIVLNLSHLMTWSGRAC